MKILIGQNLYTVSDDFHAVDDGALGITYKNRSLIEISSQQSPDTRRYTLFHELMHAVADHVGVQDEEKLDEESWISRISPTLLDVLSTNEGLLTSLL
jgi:Zn-dependent peptidase ImmA (M78 family)